MKQKTTAVTHPLVGKWFHSFQEDGIVQWQGQITAEVSTDVFLVILYDFLSGCNTTQKLIRLTQMETWRFYDSNKEMRQVYEHDLGPQSARIMALRGVTLEDDGEDGF